MPCLHWEFDLPYWTYFEAEFDQRVTAWKVLPRKCVALMYSSTHFSREAVLKITSCLYSDIFDSEGVPHLTDCCCCSVDSMWCGRPLLSCFFRVCYLDCAILIARVAAHYYSWRENSMRPVPCSSCAPPRCFDGMVDAASRGAEARPVAMPCNSGLKILSVLVSTSTMPASYQTGVIVVFSS